jgi:hypothetical protein
LEYLSRCYSEAAQKAKIIIANVKNGTENIWLFSKVMV